MPRCTTSSNTPKTRARRIDMLSFPAGGLAAASLRRKRQHALQGEFDMLNIRVLTLTLILAAPAAADDWPQWLGPQRLGKSLEKVAPWKESPKVIWRMPAGEGNSSP